MAIEIIEVIKFEVSCIKMYLSWRFIHFLAPVGAATKMVGFGKRSDSEFPLRGKPREGEKTKCDTGTLYIIGHHMGKKRSATRVL